MTQATTTGVEHAVRGRRAVWEMARLLTPDASPWTLEYFKACLGLSETRLGALLTPSSTANMARAVPFRRAALSDLLHFWLAVGIGLVMLIKVLCQFSRRHAAGELAEPGQTLIAVHGEWSNRTRHLLIRLKSDLQPAAIVVLGRPQRPLPQVISSWTGELGIAPPPVVVPLSWKAFRSCAPQIPRMLATGLRELRRTPLRPAVREHGAIAFRVLLGLIQQHWWQTHGARGVQVFFGHTGLGDTMQLERQMQRQACTTAHVVHGICTGPNFVGFSNYAFFQCGADADQYAELRHYGHCDAPPADMPVWQRGSQGMLLLSNLAHPMNSGYQAHGIADELGLMQATVALAIRLGVSADSLYWKPHPLMAALPIQQRQTLEKKARALQLRIVTPGQDWHALALRMRWVFTTPSTTIVDLLRLGCLPALIDWQGSVQDGAAARLPFHCAKTHATPGPLLAPPATDQPLESLQHLAWSAVRPADVSRAQLTLPAARVQV